MVARHQLEENPNPPTGRPALPQPQPERSPCAPDQVSAAPLVALGVADEGLCLPPPAQAGALSLYERVMLVGPTPSIVGASADLAEFRRRNWRPRRDGRLWPWAMT